MKYNNTYHQGMMGDALYNATRHCWRLGVRRDEATNAIASYHGVVIEIYTINNWNFVPLQNRWEFEGIIAPENDQIRLHFPINNPTGFQNGGNPVRYIQF